VQVQTDRCLSEFSTFGIGGPIRYFLEVSSEQEMLEAFHWASKEKIPLFILGKGSNSLFSDAGFDGLVILNKIHWIEWGEQKVRVGSGYSFSLLGMQTAKRGWSGLEFGSGIPASVGGAIFMNAGANGKETSERLESLVFLTTQGERQVLLKKEISFDYRESMFQKKSGAILEATFHFELSPAARETQLAIIDRRMKTQPLKEKSAGCIFRNPPGSLSAGALIEQCGLKGFSVGGAQVSEVHANFIVNTKDASAWDVKELIEEVKKKVREKTGIELELEVRIL
jgi:UDP-N-acetylmuramate dehydrogenase